MLLPLLLDGEEIEARRRDRQTLHASRRYVGTKL
jgi:hypothetical protein